MPFKLMDEFEFTNSENTNFPSIENIFTSKLSESDAALFEIKTSVLAGFG
jgi:hypothetical protein